MAKPELGTKRIDPETGKKFYDLNKDPVVSPYTGVSYPRSVFEAKPERGRGSPERAAAPVAAAEEEEEEEEVEDVAVIEADADVVSLEDVEEEAEADVGPDVDADEEEVTIPDAEIDVDAEIEPTDDPAFLEDEEEEGDDVADLLDVEGADEEEV